LVLTLWAPDRRGAPKLCYADVTRARRIRTDSGVWGAFGLDVLRVGQFPECRLMQYKRGGFFSIGEWLLDANERTYPQFVEFLEPFKTWAARAVRLEIVSALYDKYGFIPPDDEPLALDEEETNDRAEARPLSSEEVVRIEKPKQKGRLVTRRHQFDAVIGESIRVRGLRLAGKKGAATLVLPTSEGLRLRPIQLERHIELEIVRRAEGFGIEPQPFAA
jgi:hypothetical protein